MAAMSTSMLQGTPICVRTPVYRCLHQGLETPSDAVPLSSEEVRDMLSELQGDWMAKSAMVVRQFAIRESSVTMTFA